MPHVAERAMVWPAMGKKKIVTLLNHPAQAFSLHHAIELVQMHGKQASPSDL